MLASVAVLAAALALQAPPAGAGAAGAPRKPAFDVPPARPADLGEIHVAQDACPFECCRYGSWTARRAVDVVELPGSLNVLGRIAAGEAVVAEGGEVHVRPHPARALKPWTLRCGTPGPAEDVPVSPGEVVWILSYEGEATSRLRHRGRDCTGDTFFDMDDGCTVDGGHDSCWAVSDPRSDEDRLGRWWVRVLTGAGVRGWVDNTGSHFDGSDGCS